MSYLNVNSENNAIRTHRSGKLAILLLMMLTCLISVMALIFDSNQPAEYNFLFLLPLTFLISSILFCNVMINLSLYNIGIVLIIAQLYVRNVITPFVMCIGDYTSIFPQIESSYINMAIFLMSYEVLACFFVIFLFVKRHHICREQVTHQFVVGFHSNAVANSIIVALSLFYIAFWFVAPVTRDSYRTFFKLILDGTKDNPYNYTSYVTAGTLPRVISTLSNFVFSILRIIVPAQIIIKLSLKKATAPRFVISLFLILLQFLFIPEAVAVPVIVVFILFLLMFDLYPKKRKLFYFLVLGLAITVVFIFTLEYMTIIRWYSFNNISQYMSYWLNSYLTGVDNVAMSGLLPDRNRFIILFQTLIGALPFRTTILPQTVDLETINTLFISLPMCEGQIVSTIGSGRYLFSFIFAPIVSMLFTYIAGKYGEKYRKSNNVWKRVAYLYMTVEVALGLGVYNLPITLTHIVEVGIPLLIIVAFYGKDSKQTLPSDSRINVLYT